MTDVTFSAKIATSIMDNKPMKGVRSMDEMKFESKFTTAIVSKIVEKVVKKKLGYDIDVQLNKFRTTVIDDLTHVHLDVDLELSKEDLDKILKGIGL